MSLFDKLSNLIFEEDSSADKSGKKTTPSKSKNSWTDIFFEDSSNQESKPKKKGFMDIFFEEEPVEDDDIKSTFVVGDEKTSVLDDISSKISRRESELINLSSFFKTVNPKDFPDSSAEYESYLSLVRQLNEIKALANSGKTSTIGNISNYQLESSFKKFELDYQKHIGAIQSLCYLSEITTLNNDMETLFSSHFTKQTEHKINQIESYISLISKKSDMFDKKYSPRLYKELIESEYRLTLLKLMVELKNGTEPRKNPFATFSSQKKRTFETFLSKDIRESNTRYNSIANHKTKYTKYGLVSDEYFDNLDASAVVISDKLNKYTIDDFLLSELLGNGEGYETLKRFLCFKLNLNYIDSKTPEAEKQFLDDQYQTVTSRKKTTPSKKQSTPTSTRKPKTSRNYPSFDDE